MGEEGCRRLAIVILIDSWWYRLAGVYLHSHRKCSASLACVCLVAASFLTYGHIEKLSRFDDIDYSIDVLEDR